MHLDWHDLWTFIKLAVSALGGFAGVTQIFEWFYSRPKIVGDIEQSIVTGFKWKKPGEVVSGSHFFTVSLSDQCTDQAHDYPLI
jgi:hypothetical protein